MGGPTFIYRGLNQLKPEMIAEATARAREGAEKFAADSRSGLAGIRRALYLGVYNPSDVSLPPWSLCVGVSIAFAAAMPASWLSAPAATLSSTVRRSK